MPDGGFFDAALASAGLPEPGALRERASVWLPLSLLVMCLYTAATAAGPAFHLSSAERNFLLCAPLSRRDVLLYKFFMFVLGAALSAALLSLLTTSSGLRSAIFVGTFVTFTFAQLVSVCINMIVTQPHSNLTAYVRWALLGLVIALALSFGQTVFLEHTSITQLLAESRFLPWLTAPFTPYTYVLTATTHLQVAMWGAIALAINFALLLLIIRLDARNPTSFDPPTVAVQDGDSRRVDLLRSFNDWLLKRNPIAGQQFITALRDSGRRVALLFLLMPLLGPVLLLPSESLAQGTRFGLLFVVAAYVLPRSLVFDFRSEMSKVSYHKSLPMSPWRICFGQLLVPVIISTALIWLLMLSALPWMPTAQRTLVIQLAPFVPFANALLFAADNLLFLLFPKTHIPAGRVDFDFMGRAVIELLAKTTLLTLASGAAFWVAVTTVRVLDVDRLGLILSAIATMGAILAVMIVVMSAALQRFEPH